MTWRQSEDPRQPLADGGPRHERAQLFWCGLLHLERAPLRRGGRVRGGLGDRGPHAVGAPPGGLVLPDVGAAGADRPPRALDLEPPGAPLLLHGELDLATGEAGGRHLALRRHAPAEPHGAAPEAAQLEGHRGSELGRRLTAVAGGQDDRRMPRGRRIEIAARHPAAIGIDEADRAEVARPATAARVLSVPRDAAVRGGEDDERTDDEVARSIFRAAHCPAVNGIDEADRAEARESAWELPSAVLSLIHI